MEGSELTAMAILELAYEKVGATIVPSITDSDPDVILGIKEPTIKSINNLISKNPTKERTWMVFSHTHKGQVGPLFLCPPMSDS
jgi:alpha-aminoadipic semialdehyde synthase